MKDKSIKDLAFRLKDINLEKNQLETEINRLDKEYNEIVHELWNRIPTLENDPNLELQKVRKK